MSHTPINQLLNPSIEKILDGIEELNKAIFESFKDSSEWRESHLNELSDIQTELSPLYLRLKQLKDTTR